MCVIWFEIKNTIPCSNSNEKFFGIKQLQLKTRDPALAPADNSEFYSSVDNDVA